MGNKKKLINKGLIDLFPKEIDTFIEPFAGSAIVSMNVKANNYFISDIDSNLCVLYELFKTTSASAIIAHINSRIDEYGLARERTKRNEFKDKDKIEVYKSAYMNFRSYFNKHKNTLDFYTLMFYSFSQQFRFNSKGDFNMPCGNDCFSVKNEEYIKNGCNFFSKSNVCIKNNHYELIIQPYIYQEIGNDFIYFDPPYVETDAVYNEKGNWDSETAANLYNNCDRLTKNNVKWALSSVLENKGKVNSQLAYWLSLHNEYNVYSFDGFTYMACGKGNSHAKEVLITNYPKEN